MTEPESEKPEDACKPGKVEGPRPPDWTEGLKRLYDSVVEEPLPDAFRELLARLDDDSK